MTHFLFAGIVSHALGLTSRNLSGVLGLISTLTVEQLLVTLVGTIVGQTIVQTRTLTTLPSDGENMTDDAAVRADGAGRRHRARQSGPDATVRGTSGGGAIGGAIAGAAIGASFGIGGTVGGAIVGASVGDSLEAFALR